MSQLPHAEDAGATSEAPVGSQSTVPNEGKHKYVINECGILAERTVNGLTQYLVGWEGYGEERKSWEPKEVFDFPKTIAEWEEKKARVAAGLETPLDIQAFQNRVNAILEATAQRKVSRRGRKHGGSHKAASDLDKALDIRIVRYKSLQGSIKPAPDTGRDGHAAVLRQMLLSIEDRSDTSWLEDDLSERKEGKVVEESFAPGEARGVVGEEEGELVDKSHQLRKAKEIVSEEANAEDTFWSDPKIVAAGGRRQERSRVSSTSTILLTVSLILYRSLETLRILM